jgi:hypothetical protein
VKLAKAEAFGVLDYHYRRIWHVDAHLDDRRGHHNLGFAAGEAPHLPFFVFGAHAAVNDAHLVLGLRKITAHALVSVHEVLVVEFFGLFDERINHVNLPAEGDFFFEKTPQRQAVGVGAVQRLNGFAARRKLVNHRLLKVAVQAHGKCARNRRGRHHQHVRCRTVLGQQLRALRHPKAVLLVDHRESKVAKDDGVLNQRVGSDQKVQAAVGQIS